MNYNKLYIVFWLIPHFFTDDGVIFILGCIGKLNITRSISKFIKNNRQIWSSFISTTDKLPISPSNFSPYKHSAETFLTK